MQRDSIIVGCLLSRAFGACIERLSSDVGHERERSADRVTVASQMRLNVASAAILRASKQKLPG
jgi:hypothetical protein